MTFKVARSNPDILLTHKLKIPQTNLGLQLLLVRKFQKAVERNKLRRTLQEWLLTNIQKLITTNHIGYLLTLNLGISAMMKADFLEEFQNQCSNLV